MTTTIGRPCVAVDRQGVEHPLPIHDAFMRSTKKRQIFVAHRRGRKTSKSLEKVFQYLMVNPGIVGKTLAPIRKQAKEIIWDDPDMLFSIVPPSVIASINKSDLKITLVNGSIWSLDGADDPDTKRGGNIKVLHLTEAGDHVESLWTDVYEPVLRANNGVAIFEGNPRGQNWYYHLTNFAKAHPETWDVFIATANDTPIFTAQDLAELKQQLPEAVFEAEYMCGWVSSVGVVFRTLDQIAIATPASVQAKRKYRMGIDLGKANDYTVLSVVDRHTWAQAHLARFNQLDWPTQKDNIIKLAQHFGRKDNDNEIELLIECNGPGTPIFDDLFAYFSQDKHHNVFVVPFTTTNASKNLLVTNFSMLSDLNQIQILNYPVLLNEMRTFTYKKNGNTITYSAPPNLFDDCVMATLLSFWQLGGKLPLPVFEELPPRHQWGLPPSHFKNSNTLNNPFVQPI